MLNKEQKSNIKENGINTSIDCKKSNGAPSDSIGNGDKELSAAIIATILPMLDQQFGAIIALELAKKRGEE